MLLPLLSRRNFISTIGMALISEAGPFEVNAEVSKGAGGQYLFSAYYESWFARMNSDGVFDADLVSVPQSVNILKLAFMRPDGKYSRGGSLRDTGLQFSYTARVLHSSIERLRRGNPSIKILLSVGGESYSRWEHLNPDAIGAVVRDFELDGVDIDFEPSNPKCGPGGGSISCESDWALLNAVEQLRAAIPPPQTLSLAAVSTGAFGESQWKTAPPVGGNAYGMLLALFRKPKLAHFLDLISIMAYDAGQDFDPLHALAAYRSYYKGPILMGFSPPPENWGNHAYTLAEVERVLNAALDTGAGGAMLFSLRKQRTSESLPSSHQFVQVISETLRRRASTVR